MVKSKEKEESKISEDKPVQNKKTSAKLTELETSLKLIDANLAQLKQKERDTINWVNTSQEVGRKQLRAVENMKLTNFLQEESLKAARNKLLKEIEQIKEEK